MAEAYAAAVQGACPDGPLHLLGWSFGGLVALELARRLADAGRDIASLTLLDSYAPASDAAPLAPTDVLALLARDLGLAVPDDALAGLTADAALARVAELAHAAGILPAHLGAAHLGRRLAVLMAHLAAEQHHTALPPPGRVAVVTLIRARDAGAGGGVDPAATWRDVLPAVTVLDAPGDHFAMVQPPCVDELAGLVDGILASVLPPAA
jgi:thioesterase domain-containing protein